STQQTSRLAQCRLSVSESQGVVPLRLAVDVTGRERARRIGLEPEPDRLADPSIHQARRTLLLGRRKPHLVHRRDDARLLGPDQRKRAKIYQRGQDDNSKHSPSSRSIEPDRTPISPSPLPATDQSPRAGL